jgi:hypothetical protein
MTRDRRSLHQGLFSKQLADRRPLVLAFEEFVPVFLRFLPGDEFVERGDVSAAETASVQFVGLERK